MCEKKVCECYQAITDDGSVMSKEDTEMLIGNLIEENDNLRLSMRILVTIQILTIGAIVFIFGSR